jgi:hypothetical protein
MRSWPSTTESGRTKLWAFAVSADEYARSARVYRGLEELRYPFHDAPLNHANYDGS